MRPRGFNSATRAAGRSWRTIWQKTFCSRTRRAMSWPYCEPKSKIRMRSRSGSGVMAGRGLFIGELGEQLLQRGLVLHGPGFHEALDLPLELVAVIDQFYFPALAGHVDLDHEGVVAAAVQCPGDPGPVETFEEREKRSQSVVFHRSYSPLE